MSRTRILAFLVLAGALSADIAVPAAGQRQQAAPERFDLLIRNGRVYDGTGNPWLQLDIGITGDRIRAMRRMPDAVASRVIDAAGLVVSPGFIDVHSHAGPGLLTENLKSGQPVLAQGITTVLVNPDGGGPTDLGEQRSRYEKQGIGPNVGLFVPHGSVRRDVLGMSDRDPDSEEVARMVDMVRQGMRAGAVGLSSGLYYAPGSYSKTEEVVAMARMAAQFGGVYASHIRDESDYTIGVVAAVQEVITIAEEAGIVGVVSHMKALGPASWGLSLALIERIEAARARGVQVFADQYPYDASGTSIGGALVPRWAQVDGRDALVRRMKGADRPKLAADIRTNIARRGGPETLMVSRFAPDASLEGRTLAELAAEAHKPAEEVALDLLARSDASLVSFNMSERDIALIMQRPWKMTCTDGTLVPMGQGKPHPRAYGAFPRKINRYVEERGVIDLPFAIRSMTSLPAAVFGLKDRGVLRPGAIADILVFDPAQVRDVATYQDPHQLAEGMRDVIVNGELVRDDNRFTGARPGRVLRPER
jgi:N-acyl-D-aspartate/D-glutamate deacylase